MLASVGFESERGGSCGAARSVRQIVRSETYYVSKHHMFARRHGRIRRIGAADIRAGGGGLHSGRSAKSHRHGERWRGDAQLEQELDSQWREPGRREQLVAGQIPGPLPQGRELPGRRRLAKHRRQHLPDDRPHGDGAGERRGLCLPDPQSLRCLSELGVVIHQAVRPVIRPRDSDAGRSRARLRRGRCDRRPELHARRRDRGAGAAGSDRRRGNAELRADAGPAGGPQPRHGDAHRQRDADGDPGGDELQLDRHRRRRRHRQPQLHHRGAGPAADIRQRQRCGFGLAFPSVFFVFAGVGRAAPGGDGRRGRGDLCADASVARRLRFHGFGSADQGVGDSQIGRRRIDSALQDLHPDGDG